MRALALLLAVPSVLAAQDVATIANARPVAAESSARGVNPSTSTIAVRAERAPVLDGRDDDAVWAGAQVVSDFKMFDPNEDAEPRFRTEARIAYDDRNLYILVRAFDPHPDSIRALLSRRDERTASDWIKVLIDSYHDRRTAYEFAVNPAGVKRDIYSFNDGEEDASWDAVWDVATRVDSAGWVAEFKIPLNQLRYPNADSHTFGIMVNRDIGRYNERLAWPAFRRSKGGVSSQFGEVSGITGISTPRRLEVAPYTVASSRNTIVGGSYAMQSRGTVGADIKYGLTSNLTLDATVNPDFGQVESDPSVLNLSTSESFFPEKRPFFLEGQGLFRFDMNCNDGVCSGLFYSRRIGRSPQMPQYDDALDDPSNAQNTTILGAAKLTGRLSNGVSVGMLSALTGQEVAPGGQTIEPRTTYLVGRVQKDVSGGASSIGFMGTAMRRNLDAVTDPYLRREAYVGGVDARHQFGGRNYEVNGYFTQSIVRGSADAIALTQASFVHNYQQPDDNVAYDPTRTSLGGNSWQVMLSKRGGGKTRFTTGYQYISPGFESNDVGYLSYANVQNQFAWYQVQFRTPRSIYRQASINFNQWTNWTAGGLRTELGGNVNAHMQFKNNMWLHVGQGVNAMATSDCSLCLRGGPALRQSRSLWGWAGMEGDSRRAVTPNFFTNWGLGDEGHSYNIYLNPSVDVRVASRFSASLGLDYTRAVNDPQWRGRAGDLGADSTHYTVAALDQKVMSFTTRINFTATPTLSFQYFARPFITAGAYSNWRQVVDPRAQSYDARFAPYAGQSGQAVGDWDFNFKQYRSNAVMRWEYRPGSVLYVVWGQERTEGEKDPGVFAARRDFTSLFGAHPGNVFLIKGSYWLSL